MAPTRRVLLAALAALGACAYGLSTRPVGPPAAGAEVPHTSGAGGRAHHAAKARHARHERRRTRGRRARRCARSSSFHASGGHRRHRPHKRGICDRAVRHRHAHHSSARLAAPTPATDGSGPCADASLTPGEGDLGRIRSATMCLVNRERAARGERPLQVNARLQRAAQSHAEQMASEDYFEHVGPAGDTPVARMRACGYIDSSRVGFEVGENIAWGTLWEATPRAIVAAWMASPGHRANILDAHFRDTAIGVTPHPPASRAEGQQGAMYTQDFGVLIPG